MALKANRSPEKNARAHQRNESRREAGRQQNIDRILKTMDKRNGSISKEDRSFLNRFSPAHKDLKNEPAQKESKKDRAAAKAKSE